MNGRVCRSLLVVIAIAVAGCAQATAPSGFSLTLTGNVLESQRHNVTVTTTGTLTLTLNWSDVSKDLGLYLGGAGCASSDVFSCADLLEGTEPKTGTTARIVRPVQNGQSYAVYVVNLGGGSVPYTVKAEIPAATSR